MLANLLMNPEGGKQQQAEYPQGAQPGANYTNMFLSNLLNIIQGMEQSYSPGGNPFEAPMSMDVSNLPSLIGSTAAKTYKLGGKLEDFNPSIRGAVESGASPSFLQRLSGTAISTNRGYRNAAAAGFWDNPESYIGPAGEPRKMFHITRNPGFNEFDTLGSKQLGSHFGSEVQVSGIYSSQKSLGGPKGEGIYPTYLNIKNPLRMRDLEDFSAGRVAEEAHRMGVFSKEEYERIKEVLGNYARSYRNGIYTEQQYNRLANDWVISGLELRGYDGIVYLNRKEIAMREGGNPAEWVRKYRPDLTGERTSPSEMSPLYKFMENASDRWWYEHIPSDDSVIAFRPEQIHTAIGIKRALE
jgi:hypothetical protein